MATLESCPKHNMVLCLEKTKGNAQFHEIFWNSATSKTLNNVSQIKAKVASQRVVITEASFRRDLLFNDVDEIDCLSTQAIFGNLALMGYEGDLTKLNFQKTIFSPYVGDQTHETASSSSPENTQSPKILLEGTGRLWEDQTMEHIPKDSPSSGGQTSRGDESELTLHDLLVTCTKLSKQVLRLVKDKNAQAAKILNLKERVNKLEKRQSIYKHRYKLSGDFNKLDDLVDEGADYAVNEGRSTDKIKVLNAIAEGVSASGETLSVATLAVNVVCPSNQEDVQDLFDDETSIVDILVNIANARPRPVVITDPEQEQRRARPIVQLAIDPKDKGKGKIVEPEPIKELKKRDFDAAQIARDEEVARELEAQLQAELEKERQRAEQASVDYITSLYDEVQVKMATSKELASDYKWKKEKCIQLKKDQALYLNEHAMITDFVPIGSENDERGIRDMNKKRKRESSDKEEEQLRVFLNIIPDEEGEVDYAVLDKRVFRADRSSRYIKTFTEMVSKFDRKVQIDLWKNREEWILKSWNFYDNYIVHILMLEDGTEFYMLTERRYPLTKETLERMIALRLIAESESEAVFDLLRFIQKQIDEM
uniref:Uncharacterized protein n=1 Tax=Tanacetum cinerariifolium TaxID=118510 RepID=A0A6L2KR87_TANCI|nr:hypothetical protein [Tanacetum cinerariifolium]